jgi:hypothetical protein
VDTLSLYNENRGILEGVLSDTKEKLALALKKACEERINLKSIKAMVAKEMDGKDYSKAALKDIILGDQRVLDQDAKVDKWETQIQIMKTEWDFIEHSINNNKKMMDSLNNDKRYLGG